MDLTILKIAELSEKCPLIPSPGDENTITISGILLFDCWLALCRQSPDLYDTYGLSVDKDEAINSAIYGPEKTREFSIEFFGELNRLNWQINRNGWTISGEAIIADGHLLYHRENF